MRSPEEKLLEVLLTFDLSDKRLLFLDFLRFLTTRADLVELECLEYPFLMYVRRVCPSSESYYFSKWVSKVAGNLMVYHRKVYNEERLGMEDTELPEAN